jgi:hypothetical protein
VVLSSPAGRRVWTQPAAPTRCTRLELFQRARIIISRALIKGHCCRFDERKVSKYCGQNILECLSCFLVFVYSSVGPYICFINYCLSDISLPDASRKNGI